MSGAQPTPARTLLDELRRIGASECRALDAATAPLSDREKVLLSAQLARIATHIGSRVGTAQGLPPPDILPGSSSGRLDLSAQLPSVIVAAVFVRNTLHRWGWADVALDTECAVRELLTAFVTAIDAAEPIAPTRMTLRLRALSHRRLVVELRDCPANAAIIATAGYLISTHIERISVRSGQHTAAGRTVVWCELARPEFSRWI